MNPRAILAGAAALPATALPAVAEPDPVFAAIEAHRRAHAARAPSCHRREEIIHLPGRKISVHVNLRLCVDLSGQRATILDARFHKFFSRHSLVVDAIRDGLR